jgi:hypothetical protein
MAQTPLPPPGGCPAGTHFEVFENPNQPGTLVGSCVPDSSGSRRRPFTDQQMIDQVTAKVQAAMASQLTTVGTGQPMEPEPTLDPATVAGIQLAVTQIATITTAWRLQVFRANPPLMDGSKVSRPATTAEKALLAFMLKGVTTPTNLAPIVGSHGSMDPTFLLGKIAEYANTPGAYTSLATDPNYWVGAIISSGGWDEGYWANKFMVPAGEVG